MTPPHLDDAKNATYCCENHTARVAELTPTHETKTPWKLVYDKFGMSQSAFARAINRHRSKVSRVLKDEKGLISGRDQEKIIEVAEELNIVITPDDLTPARK